MGRCLECEGKMRRIAIIAPTGLLGSMVYNVLKDSYKLTLLYRSKDTLKALDDAYGDVKKHFAMPIDLEKLYERYIFSGKDSKVAKGNPLFSLDVDKIIGIAKCFLTS